MVFGIITSLVFIFIFIKTDLFNCMQFIIRQLILSSYFSITKNISFLIFS
ncbi:hypothetical protein RICGR_0246 [Rickettsiella grylli]|uniref:Uncharacterized protein n=1 Tax=Rickettsiella grylli TaxID=59196 RepID=A8PL67_9COXI|nr:hypothetical protein RICGR_0246 [Rickettsiella grylli]